MKINNKGVEKTKAAILYLKGIILLLKAINCESRVFYLKLGLTNSRCWYYKKVQV